MKNLLAFALILLTGTSLVYFKYQRPVEPSGAGQHYVVVDEVLWRHARPDLADLRFYSGSTEIPYALTTERGSLEKDHRDVRVLQQSIVGGKTQFLIDMTDIVEYDHVDLKLSSRNFVAHARIEGQDNLHGRQWAVLGDSILYDLSKENLGSNSMLRIPRSSYHYLRVTIDGPVKPEEVTGAASEHRQEQAPIWRDVSRQMSQQEQGRDTILTFSVPDNVPVERAVFSINPTQPNFRREVEIRNQTMEIGSGEINRVHMIRSGQKIDSEAQTINFSTLGRGSLEAVIHNGDDLPLKLTGARLQQHERRIYFDVPPASGPLTLYYGDEKLGSPLYDYAKLFQQEPNAAWAPLGAESANGAYTSRPDDRAWSERHPALLWIAIIAAVAVLGALALRSMTSAAAT